MIIMVWRKRLNEKFLEIWDIIIIQCNKILNFCWQLKEYEFWANLFNYGNEFKIHLKISKITVSRHNNKRIRFFRTKTKSFTKGGEALTSTFSHYCKLLKQFSYNKSLGLTNIIYSIWKNRTNSQNFSHQIHKLITIYILSSYIKLQT